MTNDCTETEPILANQPYGTYGPLMEVLDIPGATTAEEMARILNEHCARGLYVNAVCAWPGVGARVILRRYAKVTGKAQAEAKMAAKQPSTDKALVLLRAHPGLSTRESARMLAGQGLKHGKDWVAQMRKELALTP